MAVTSFMNDPLGRNRKQTISFIGLPPALQEFQLNKLLFIRKTLLTSKQDRKTEMTRFTLAMFS